VAHRHSYTGGSARVTKGLSDFDHPPVRRSRGRTHTPSGAFRRGQAGGLGRYGLWRRGLCVSGWSSPSW
jgi:hypothetical protein